jgi:hypothetical protein
LEREQYCIDRFNPEYNILKFEGSLRGFKHREVTKEIMSLKRNNSIVSDEKRLKIEATISKGEHILVKNNEKVKFYLFYLLEKLQNLLVFILVI